MAKDAGGHGGGGGGGGSSLKLHHPAVLVTVVVVGALLGSFLGKFIGVYAPEGPLRALFSEEISAGLHPTILDLRIIDLTFGCEFKLNVTSLIGIVTSALMFKGVFR